MSTPTPIDRNPVTNLVLAKLRELPQPCGDGQMPKGANWIGQPNAPGSKFDSYLVLSEITASHSWGPWADWQADWQLPYLIESFGLSRLACAAMMSAARSKLQELKRETFSIGPTEYGVMYVKIDSLGEPQRRPALQPPVWSLQESTTLWIGKGA